MMKYLLLTCAAIMCAAVCAKDKVKFPREFSPSEGVVNTYEAPFRKEICLNGLWDIQFAEVPKGYKFRKNMPAPELPTPIAGKWEEVKIKIPSPWNVNGWSKMPDKFAPSANYFPSYPESWIHKLMGWLKKDFTVPADWQSGRVVLRFDAVAGYCKVYVNGKLAGEHFDMHMPFELDITDLVKFGKENEVLVGVRSGRFFEKQHPVHEKAFVTYPNGSMTAPILGIWQDVFLLYKPDVYVADIFAKPFVGKGELEFDVEIAKKSASEKSLELKGEIYEWINKAGKDTLSAPEPKWTLSKNPRLSLPEVKVAIPANSSKTLTLKVAPNGKLKLWSPNEPNLYMSLFEILESGKVKDKKTARFGWREFKVVGDHFELNGEKIKLHADFLHPFSAVICSRRYAWAWYKMIKDFGGNAVRPHAQPWPNDYYKLADEMGIMVLAENGLFGSSICQNLSEEDTWRRVRAQTEELVKRNRNNPSVIGWSVGNEMFAMSLPHIHKVEPEEKAKWDAKLVEMSKVPPTLDPTRNFVTIDGDQDMNGELNNWTKHIGHNMSPTFLSDVRAKLNYPKPMICGEYGATYYGTPSILYPYIGDAAYTSYEGRAAGIAADLYHNFFNGGLKDLDYLSPSLVAWYGIRHLPIGYSDFNRLPTLEDGVFAGVEYKEGIPGCQFERIPPYVTALNPDFAPSLPLYKPLPLFEAYKAALAGKPCKWDKLTIHKKPQKKLPEANIEKALFIGKADSKLAKFLEYSGVKFTSEPFKGAKFIFIDAENASKKDIEKLLKELGKGAKVFAMLSSKTPSEAFAKILPQKLELSTSQATALNKNPESELASYFEIPDLYFSELKNEKNEWARDKQILKAGLSGKLVKNSEVIFKASDTDWSMFNQKPEHSKASSICLYEDMIKPEGAALIKFNLKGSDFYICALDYSLRGFREGILENKPEKKSVRAFWQRLFNALDLKTSDEVAGEAAKSKNKHDLLLDGPIN